jgi:hypothetical protein
MTDVRSHPGFNKDQHCTFEQQDGVHDYSFSHTAGYCGKPQPRFCGCPFDYGGHPPDEVQPEPDDIGTVRWFGVSWGAPVNDPRAWIETPRSAVCLGCGVWIKNGEQGMQIPSTDGFVFFHLDCFLKDIGVSQGAEIFHD